MKAIVTGMIATYPVGGVVFDYGQYVVGMKQLGFDVLYLEDTGGQTYDPVAGLYGDNPSYGITYLSESLKYLDLGMQDRWCFRELDGTCHGLSRDGLQRFIDEADVFINVSNSALLREEYVRCPAKLMIDSDPGLNHFVNYPKWDKNGGYPGTHGFRCHDAFFTYAENIGGEGCTLPDLALDWHTTRPVVIPELWPAAQTHGGDWTTVMTWKNYRDPVIYKGREYGAKEKEFHHVVELPAKSGIGMEISSGGSDPPFDQWRAAGWRCRDAREVSQTPEVYRQYITESRGEISVAKNIYVATNSGWFSCRSICYMMAGRPVVLQDTGFSRYIPTGEGVMAFESEASALAAIQAVETDYPRHAEAARRIALEYFSPQAVLKPMLKDAGVSLPLTSTGDK